MKSINYFLIVLILLQNTKTENDNKKIPKKLCEKCGEPLCNNIKNLIIVIIFLL